MSSSQISKSTMLSLSKKLDEIIKNNQITGYDMENIFSLSSFILEYLANVEVQSNDFWILLRIASK